MNGIWDNHVLWGESLLDSYFVCDPLPSEMTFKTKQTQSEHDNGFPVACSYAGWSLETKYSCRGERYHFSRDSDLLFCFSEPANLPHVCS